VIEVEKLIHSLGISSMRELAFYILVVWLIVFIGLEILLYPFVELGIISFGFLVQLIPWVFLFSLLIAIGSITIPMAIKRESIVNNFPIFIVFMGSMTTAKANYEEFFKTMANTKEYGEISKEMKRLYHLARDWKLGYSQACKVVADTTPAPIFSNFLSRLSQVVEYGEDLVFFFKTQFKDILRDIQMSYQESIYKITTISELFSALFVSTAFVLSFLAMAPIFFPIPNSLLYFAFIGGMVAIDVIILVLARTSVPPDKLANDSPNIAPEHLTAILAGIIGVSLALLIWFLAYLLGASPIIQVALTTVPLIVPGYLAWKAEKLIRTREHSYLPFIRTLGELVSIREGAIVPVIRRLRRHIYPGMNEALERPYRRLAVTRNVYYAFKLFSKELGSDLLSKFNELFINTLYAGADPKMTGSIIGHQLHTLLDARKLRLQVSSGARGTIYGTYWGVALGVFLAVKSLAAVFIMFHGVLSGLGSDVVGMIPFFNFNVDLRPMVDVLVYVFAIEAAFLAYLIKMLDGGLKVEAILHYVILIIGLMAVYYLTDIGLAMILPSAQQAINITP
jgi:flagellar protein FlaJ